MILTLERFCYAHCGTFGEIKLPGDKSVYTVERPWLGNAKSKSCIPEGVYTLRKRESPVVRRTTRGQYTEGWEVTNVPDRTFIMWHPGNTMLDLEGCIAPGMSLGFIGNKWAVTSSQIAFRRFMDALTEDEYTLDIRPKIVSYP